ncbi:hypothetical protein V492_06299 [Pseudogymnoascus sp. VKM F-4246]|nr:hypothetical protein V492_06299 [Pseudogymnoascus sp. VKM F-4246]
MDPIDLSGLSSLALEPTPSRQVKDPSDIKHTIAKDGNQKTKTSVYKSLSPEFRSYMAMPRFACPFHKYDPERYSQYSYRNCVWLPLRSISGVVDHIHENHLDLFVCSECGRGFSSYHALCEHEDSGLCGRDPGSRVHQAITSIELAAIDKMRRFQMRQTNEEEWQDIYRHLFPDDDRTISPYYEDFTGEIDHKPKGVVSIKTPLVTPATAMGSEVQPGLKQAHTSPFTEDLPKDSSLHGRSIYNYCAPPSRDSQPSRKGMRSLPISSPPAADGPPAADEFAEELSHSNSEERLSGTSEQSTQPSEDDESQYSTSSTDLSFGPAKQLLFDGRSRQFWSFYNELSISDWTSLWIKHGIQRRGSSETQGIPETQRSTRTSSDNTQTPSGCPSNFGSLIAPKRKKRDDEDDSNNDRNPSKRSNRTSNQKKGLNLACPFHKYKPWKYNHGILRYRTCSTTPFDAIFRLKEHLSRVHPLPLNCTRCWQTFADQNSLINHGQAEIPCQRKQPVHVEGWTAEMDKKVTKRRDETARERWERIYRELFGRALSSVPSPYFVPYDPPAANESQLEALLHQEVPRILLSSMRREIDNMENPDAERYLRNISDPSMGFDTLVGQAIEEAFQIYRSATGASNNTGALPTPRSSSANSSIAGDSSVAKSTACESAPPTYSRENSHRELSGFESSLAAAPDDTMHPGATGGPSHSGSSREQIPQVTRSAPDVPDLFSQAQSSEKYPQQDDHLDMTNAFDVSMDEYAFVNFDLDGNFDDEAFPGMSSDPYGASASS